VSLAAPEDNEGAPGTAAWLENSTSTKRLILRPKKHYKGKNLWMKKEERKTSSSSISGKLFAKE